MLGRLDLGFDQPLARVVREPDAELAEDLGLVVRVGVGQVPGPQG
jgi:hypothetical protein